SIGSAVRRSPQGVALVLLLLAAVGVVLFSERGSTWLAEQLGERAPTPAPPLPSSVLVARSTVDWPGVSSAASELLQTYLRLDTSEPEQAKQAAEWLHSMLSDAGIESRLVVTGEGRSGVIARLRGQGEGPPLVLYSYIEQPHPDASRWSVPPLDGVVADGLLYGSGAAEPKGQTITNLVTLLVLHQLGVPLQRDVIFLATGSRDRLAEAQSPMLAELAQLGAEYVLGPGGGSIELEPGQRAWMVSTYTKGYLYLRVGPSREGGEPSGDLPPIASEQLVRAVNEFLTWDAPIVPSEATNEFFRRLTDRYGFPVRDVLAQPWAWSRFVAPRLTGNPAAASRLRDTVSLVRLEPWPDDPLCPSAIVAVHTMPWRAREQVLAELRAVAGVPDLRFQLLAEEAGQESSWDTALYRAIERVAEREEPGIPVLPTGADAGHGRQIRALGATYYGFLPIHLDREQLGRIGGPDECVPVEGLGQGVRRLTEIVLELCAG
ncbi:MAG: M20/M25/M40 family metallo-hydrolase, partial [Anaerolineae bacterium]|nr:M20/M25/M40 family metallo-hydrolase [Anaerolineae bacterium]